MTGLPPCTQTKPEDPFLSSLDRKEPGIANPDVRTAPLCQDVLRLNLVGVMVDQSSNSVIPLAGLLIGRSRVD